MSEIWESLEKLEKLSGKKLGDAEDPLLLSVRSGAKFSMPGMMNTILNLGLNDETVEGLVAKTGNPRFAYDCYRRFIQMFGEVALGIEKEHFDEAFDARKHKIKAKLDTDLSADDLKAIIVEYKKIVKKDLKREFPQDVREQLLLSRNAVFMSWWAPKASYYRKMEKIDDRLGTAVNVQTMVFGNMGDTCCTGVGFTRDPGSGDEDVLRRVPGERARRRRGGRHPHAAADQRRWKRGMPDVYKQLRDITASLEKHYKDMQDFEFTVQEGTLYMLQTRNGKRTGPAAVRVAVEMVEEKLIDEKTAVGRVAPVAARSTAAPGVRPGQPEEAHQARHRHRRLPGRGGRTARVHVGRRGRDVGEGSGDPDPQRDDSGRHPRHGRLEGHPDGGRRQELARGRCGARHGRSVRGRLRRDLDQRSRRRRRR